MNYSKQRNMLLGDTIQMDSSNFIEVTTLHPNEMQLLKSLRTRFRFGEVTIIMQDGVPLRLKRVTEFENLT